MMLDDVLKRLSRLVREHATQRDAAYRIGISPQYLNDILQRRRDPGPKVLKALGFRLLPRYERIPSQRSRR